MISIFIVEDEQHILETTIEMVKELDYTVSGSANSVDTAFEGINSSNPDVVLLDVELGSKTSFQLLERFSKISFKIIFVTAHQKYALDAFRFSAVDFILKPLSLKSLDQALAKAAQESERDQQEYLDILQYNLQHQGDQKIVLKTQDKIWVLKLNEVIHCESDLSYTIFHTDDERIIVSKTMGYYEELLSPYGFFRLHKSHLVNVSHVRKIHKVDGGEAELSNGGRIPISQRKKEEFFSIIDQQGLK